MLLSLMQWFCHCVRLQIDSVGVFVWALAPFLCFGLSLAVCFAVSAGETQVWLGDLRVVVFGVVVFRLLFIDLHILRTFLSLYSVLTAYSHVRTEPQCDIGQTRGKKKARQFPTPLWGEAQLLVGSRECLPLPLGRQSKPIGHIS